MTDDERPRAHGPMTEDEIAQEILEMKRWAASPGAGTRCEISTDVLRVLLNSVRVAVIPRTT